MRATLLVAFPLQWICLTHVLWLTHVAHGLESGTPAVLPNDIVGTPAGFEATGVAWMRREQHPLTRAIAPTQLTLTAHKMAAGGHVHDGNDVRLMMAVHPKGSIAQIQHQRKPVKFHSITADAPKPTTNFSSAIMSLDQREWTSNVPVSTDSGGHARLSHGKAPSHTPSQRGGNLPQHGHTKVQGHGYKAYYKSLEFYAHLVAVLLVIECFLAVAFEYLHMRWSNVDLGIPLPEMPRKQRISFRTMFAGFPKLMAPYFSSPSGLKGRACAWSIVFLGIISLFFGYVNNMWHKEFWDLFNKKDAKRFPHLMGVYSVLVLAWMLNSVYTEYLRMWLYIDWREFMTQELLRRWLYSHTHFLIQVKNGGISSKQVDNPEQRIQEDIHLFVDSALNICPDFLTALGNLCVFVPLMLYLEPKKAFGVVQLPGWLLYLSLAYSLAGTLSTHLIGWPMVNYSFARQRFEADFRLLASHVHNQSESVALYGAERTEELNLRQQFDQIKLVQWQQMILTKRLSFFTSSYSFMQFLVPFFMLAPSYFHKDISLGDLFQLTGTVGNVAGSLDWFVRSYGSVTDWRATADRLLSFEEAIDDIRKQAGQAPDSVGGGQQASQPPQMLGSTGSNGGHGAEDELVSEANMADGTGGPVAADAAGFFVRFSEIRLPSGELIFRDISLKLGRGQRALISGPEGVGKSVFFKALAGIWPHIKDGSVCFPSGDSSQVLFVPQRPALPRRCSLGHALAYPEVREAYSDDQLRTALLDVRLSQLLDQVDEADGEGNNGHAENGQLVTQPSTDLVGLDQVQDWGSRLSPGEQQRLAVGHVLLRRPRLLFLDEATSNVSTEAAKDLYKVLFHRLPEGAILVSISHDVATLKPLHDLHFVAEQGEGVAWSLQQQAS